MIATAPLDQLGVEVLDCEHKTPPACESGYPYIAIPQIQDGSVVLETARLISSNDLQEWTRRTKPRPGDVIVTRRGRVGDTAPVPDGVECAIGQNLVLLRSNGTQIDQSYLRWAARSPKWWSEVSRMLNVGAVFDSLNVRDIAKLEIPAPELDVQRAIAATLDSLDAKIQSNLRIIGLIESLGSAILDGTLGLDTVGTPTFDQQSLGEVLSVVETGTRPKGGVLAGQSGVVSLGAGNIQSAGVVSSQDFKRVPASFAAAMKRGRLENEDVLVYKDGGKPGNFVPHVSAFGYGFPVDEAVINEHVYRVRASGELSQGVLYWILRSRWMDREMRQRGTGVAIPGLNSTNFRALPYPQMTAQQLLGLNTVLEPMLTRILQLGAENRRQRDLRDTLVTALTSGLLSVGASGLTT